MVWVRLEAGEVSEVQPGGRRSFVHLHDCFLVCCFSICSRQRFRSLRSPDPYRQKAIAVPIISGEPFRCSCRAASHLARMSVGYGRRTCEIMVPAGYQLPNNWRLGGAVHLDLFLVTPVLNRRRKLMG